MAASNTDDVLDNPVPNNVLLIWITVGLIVSTLYGSLFVALTGWQFWQWFAIPLGAPDISGLHIAGLALFVSYMRYRSDSDDTLTTYRTLVRASSKMIVYPPIMAVMYLASGWIVAKMAGLA